MFVVTISFVEPIKVMLVQRISLTMHASEIPCLEDRYRRKHTHFITFGLKA
jgi:hypothetical protein